MTSRRRSPSKSEKALVGYLSPRFRIGRLPTGTCEMEQGRPAALQL